MLASLRERQAGFTSGVKIGLTASCAAVAVNFALPIVFWNSISKEVARSKSLLWLNVFWWYCVIMGVFWVCAAVRNQARGENSSSLTFGGYGSLQT